MARNDRHRTWRGLAAGRAVRFSTPFLPGRFDIRVQSCSIQTCFLAEGFVFEPLLLVYMWQGGRVLRWRVRADGLSSCPMRPPQQHHVAGFGSLGAICVSLCRDRTDVLCVLVPPIWNSFSDKYRQQSVWILSLWPTSRGGCRELLCRNRADDRHRIERRRRDAGGFRLRFHDAQLRCC